jgi:hypothetical protein
VCEFAFDLFTVFIVFFVFILVPRHKSRESVKIGPHPRGCPSSAINSLLLVLLFQRKDQFRLILFLLHPKPPRLRKVRTEMMPKTHWKGLARIRRHLLRIQKSLVSTGRGNASTRSFL